MRAVYYEAFGRPPGIVDLPVPEPPPGGVVVRVEATGLCRSDWHAWQGHDASVTLPHVPGHELVGHVTAVGDRVPESWTGRRVTTPFVCACGHCPECDSGNAQVCRNQTQPGFTHFGSFADYVAIDHADVNLVPVPDTLDAGAAASLGCRFATAHRGVAGLGAVLPGEWVVVVGCGGVGLSAVMIAKALGARVVAVDVETAALDLARSLGADAAVGSDAPDALRRITELTGGGAHVSVDAIGHEGAIGLGVGALRARGRHVQIGLLTEPPKVPMHAVIGKELSLLGSHGMAARDYPALLELVGTGALRPQLLITRRIPLEEAPAALAEMDRDRRPGMAMIDVHPRG